MKPVAIIGAGITGLTAAFYLKRAGVPVTVYEAGPRAGGVIQSLRRDGFLAEFGPNTILETSPKIAQLVRDAGLDSRRLNSAPQAEARFVVRYFDHVGEEWVVKPILSKFTSFRQANLCAPNLPFARAEPGAPGRHPLQSPSVPQGGLRGARRGRRRRSWRRRSN